MPTPLRVLIVEDSPTDAGVMIRHLGEAGYASDWQRVETEADYLACLEPTLDLILIDYTLPDFTGHRALQSLQERGWDIPAIIVTGTISEEVALELLRLGAADYLLKDRLARLGAAVQTALAQRALRREPAAAESVRHTSEARSRFLAGVLEKSSQPFGVRYLDGRIGLCNAALCTLSGYTEAELRVLDWSRDLTPPAWQAADVERLAELECTGQPVRYEKEFLRKDGAHVPVEVLMHLMPRTADSPPYTYAFVTDLTARKRAEGVWRETEERFRLAFAQAAVGLAVTDASGRFVQVNKAYCDITGYTAEELYAKEYLAITHPDDRQENLDLAQRAFASKIDSFVHEKRYVRKPGEIVWVRNSVVAIRDRAGNFVNGIALVEDITKRREAEEALRESEARYRSLFENSLDAVLLTAPDGSVLAANPEACRVFGRSEEEICQAGRAGLVDPASPCLPGLLVERARTGKAKGELIFVRKDGTKFPGEATSAVFVDRDGSLKTSMIIRDITMRKQAEEAQWASRQLLERTLASLRDAVFVLDFGTAEIVDCNAAASAIFGYDRQELLGRTTAFLHCDEAALEEFRRVLHSAVRERGFLEGYQFRMKRKDGTVFPTEHSVVPLDDGRGNRVGWVSVVRDITERQRAETALVARTRQLEAVRAITAEITRELDLQQLLRLIQRRATELVGGSGGALHLWDEEGQVLVPHAWDGLGAWFGDVRHRPGEGVVGRIAQSKQGMIVNDYQTSPDAYRPVWERTTFTAVVGEPLLSHDRLLGVITVNNEGMDRGFDQDDRAVLALFATQAAIAIENARLHERALLRAQQLATLNELTRTLTMTLNPADVAREILTAVQVLMPGTVGQLWELVDPAESFRLLAMAGAQRLEGPFREEFPAGEGLAGLAGAARHYVTSPDVRQDQRFVNRAWAAAPALFSGDCLPLVHEGRVHGYLVRARTPPAFLDPEIDLLQTFAAHAAIALENVKLFRTVLDGRVEVRAMAIRLAETEEAERKQLARELHDQVGQSLTAIGINLNILRSQMETTAKPEVLSRLDDSLRLIDHSTERIRDVMGELRPPVLDDYGLVAALRWYAERFSSRIQILAEVQGEEPVPRLPPPTEIACFRIAQEALTNVAKHAAATRVRVSVETADATVRLVIADEGVGFDPSRLKGRPRWGLIGMRERAEAVGGNCAIDSHPGKGTWVVVEVPR